MRTIEELLGEAYALNVEGHTEKAAVLVQMAQVNAIEIVAEKIGYISNNLFDGVHVLSNMNFAK